MKKVVIDNEKEVENDIKGDINLLNGFSSLLQIVSINKTNDKENKNEKVFLYLIKAFEYFINVNDFSSLKCPYCKKSNLKFHKYYQRNIIFHLYGYEIVAIIMIPVVECSHCKENISLQHYHALLPNFIFPYHIYSSIIIIDTLNDRIINKTKVDIIIERKKISHKLFYDWLRGFQKYLLPSSVILNEINIDNIVISKIITDLDNFLYEFYFYFNHPFFLFRNTCVNLCITP